MENICNIGIDLGGTNIRGGLIAENSLQHILSKNINAQGSVTEVLEELYQLTDQIIIPDVKSIGIGVPGLVDIKNGMVYDVVHIPSWKEVPLKKIMQERYGVPVFINNDANCFALGEYYFGQSTKVDSMIGLTIGTGLGSGLIINQKLYNGKNGGAGEFGMVDYLDKCYEYYAAGQFFKNVHNVSGELVFEDAKNGNITALKMYDEMGAHLGNFIKILLYSLDVDLIVLGGSVRHAMPFFTKMMWQQIETFAFKKSLKNLEIKVSELENAGVLGAAYLQYDSSLL